MTNFVPTGSPSRIGPDSPEVLELFNSKLTLATVITKRLVRPLRGFDDFDDLLSAARVGLLEAARRYDPAAGVPFPAFASYRVRGAVIDEIRRLAPHSRRVHARLTAAARLVELGEAGLAWAHDTTPKSPPSAEKAIDDALAGLAICAALTLEKSEEDPVDLETVFEQHDLLKKVHLALDSFSHDEAEIVKQHYFQDKSLTEIASELGLTLSWVSRLHSRAIARLAGRFAESTSPE